jgi:uncharacterized protein YecE (DUF72 family)
MPTPEQIQKMIERSGGKIKFTVKAFAVLTHAACTGETLEKDILLYLINEFKRAIEPLIKEKLLLCALFQFPESFHYEKQERIYLDSLLKEFSGIPVVVEMRNKNWQNEKVYNALRERNVGWCNSDNPDLKNLPKKDIVSTSDISYIRYHGRNKETWYGGDSDKRYEYNYSDEELKEFVSPTKKLLMNSKIVQLFFNNHAKGYAVVNAKKIEVLLKQ